MIEIIPAIDLLEGRVVRLVGGDYSQVTDYSSAAEAAQYWLSQGATRLHVIDLDGAKDGKLVNIKGLQEIIATGIQVQFGGGVRSWQTLEHLFELGVRSVILGTVALKDPEFMMSAMKSYKDKIILALDSKNGKFSVEGWLETSEISIEELLEKLSKSGLSRFIYTNIARDGKLTGPDISGMICLCQKFPNMQCILSGGIGSLDDLRAVRDQASNIPNLDGIISGKALYEKKFSLAEAIAVLSS